MKCLRTRSEFSKRCFLLCEILLFTLVFAGCAKDPVYIADDIDANELFSYPNDTVLTERTEETNKSRNGVTVYYTKSGTVWHTTRDCSALKRSTNVVCGTREQAESEGKDRPCKKCS